MYLLTSSEKSKPKIIGLYTYPPVLQHKVKELKLRIEAKSIAWLSTILFKSLCEKEDRARFYHDHGIRTQQLDPFEFVLVIYLANGFVLQATTKAEIIPFDQIQQRIKEKKRSRSFPESDWEELFSLICQANYLIDETF